MNNDSWTSAEAPWTSNTFTSTFKYGCYFVVLLVSSLILGQKLSLGRKKGLQIPGPKGLPLLGNIFDVSLRTRLQSTVFRLR
jgi:hypothetical protein